MQELDVNSGYFIILSEALPSCIKKNLCTPLTWVDVFSSPLWTFYYLP